MAAEALREGLRMLSAHAAESGGGDVSVGDPAGHAIVEGGPLPQASSSAASLPSSASASPDFDDGTSLDDNFKHQLEVPLAVLILLLYVVLGHTLEKWKTDQKEQQREESITSLHHNPVYSTQEGGKIVFEGWAPVSQEDVEAVQVKTPCTFHESAPAVLLGLAVGLMLNYGGAGQAFDFDADSFFYMVLPPIIFHQGFDLKHRNFFRYVHYIFCFGFLGTVIQFLVITVLAYNISGCQWLNLVSDDGVTLGLTVHESMLVASTFSAADEVATLSLIKQAEFPKLSAVLFGEGVLNDAMSILLFHAVQNSDDDEGGKGGGGGHSIRALSIAVAALYVLFMAVVVGCGIGLLVSRLLVILPSLRESPVRQTAILILGGYFSFSVSEAFELSGILGVFFTGLTLSHYAWHSLGPEARTTSKITSETLSMVAEAYCFTAIGLSVHDFNSAQWCWGFIAAMIVVLMAARGIAVYGICFFGWLFMPKRFALPHNEQHVLFFGGLVRGAITWAQVVQVKDPHGGLMATTSLGVILFTVIIFGAVMPFFTKNLTPPEVTERQEREKNKAEREQAAAAAAASTAAAKGETPHSVPTTPKEGSTTQLLAQRTAQSHGVKSEGLGSGLGLGSRAAAEAAGANMGLGAPAAIGMVTGLGLGAAAVPVPAVTTPSASSVLPAATAPSSGQPTFVNKSGQAGKLVPGVGAVPGGVSAPPTSVMHSLGKGDGGGGGNLLSGLVNAGIGLPPPSPGLAHAATASAAGGDVWGSEGVSGQPKSPMIQQHVDDPSAPLLNHQSGHHQPSPMGAQPGGGLFSNESDDLATAGMTLEEIIRERQRARGLIHSGWVWLDNKYMKPLFGGQLHEAYLDVDTLPLPKGLRDRIQSANSVQGEGDEKLPATLLPAQSPAAVRRSLSQGFEAPMVLAAGEGSGSVGVEGGAGGAGGGAGGGGAAGGGGGRRAGEVGGAGSSATVPRGKFFFSPRGAGSTNASAIHERHTAAAASAAAAFNQGEGGGRRLSRRGSGRGGESDGSVGAGKIGERMVGRKGGERERESISRSASGTGSRYGAV